MSKTAPFPELTPPVGPFSQAIEVGGFLYFSGQVAQDPATGKVVEGGSWPRRKAFSRTSRRFSRRPARVSMMSCAPVCFSRA
jgi:enamine deaminase RidA (YjgF/YER057c/UK114 family)